MFGLAEDLLITPLKKKIRVEVMALTIRSFTMSYNIDKRVRELRRAVEGVLNTYGLPLSIDELVLEGLLSTVRAQMERDSDPEEAENGKPKQS